MKKLLMIIVIAVCGIGQMHAQFYAGGSVGYTNSKVSDGGSDDQSGSSFKIMPELGYKFSDQMAFGVSLGYMKGYAAMGSFDVTDIKAFTSAIISTAIDGYSGDKGGLDLKGYRIAPYLRCNIFESDTFQFFIEAFAAYSSISVDASKMGGLAGGDTDDFDIDPSMVQDQELNGIEVGIRPGIALNLSEKCTLLARIGTLGYQSLKLKDSDTKLTRMGVDFDSNNLSLGAIFYF